MAYSAPPFFTGPASAPGTGFGAPILNGQGEVMFPIPQDPTHQILTRHLTCNVKNYAAPSLGAADPGGLGNLAGGNGYSLCIPEESVWVDGDLAKYSQKYGNLPAYRIEYESYSVNFPGIDSASVISRQPFKLIVPTRLIYSYFYYTTPEAAGAGIPITQAFYVYLNDPLYGDNSRQDYCTDSTDPNAIGYVSINIPSAPYSMCVTGTTFKRLYGYIYESVTRMADFR